MIERPGDHDCEAKVIDVGTRNLFVDEFTRGVRRRRLQRIVFPEALVTRVDLAVQVTGAHQYDSRPASNLPQALQQIERTCHVHIEH